MPGSHQADSSVHTLHTTLTCLLPRVYLVGLSHTRTTGCDQSPQTPTKGMDPKEPWAVSSHWTPRGAGQPSFLLFPPGTPPIQSEGTGKCCPHLPPCAPWGRPSCQGGGGDALARAGIVEGGAGVVWLHARLPGCFLREVVYASLGSSCRMRRWRWVQFCQRFKITVGLKPNWRNSSIQKDVKTENPNPV